MGIKSMTGFGRALAVSDACDVKVEMKSVNSKYLDLNIRMPKYLSFLEINMKNLIRDKLERGKVDVYIDVSLKKSQYRPKLNKELLKGYIDVLGEAALEFGIEGQLTMENVISLPDVIGTEEDSSLGDAVGALVMEALKNAVSELDSMRAIEGEALKDDVLVRTGILEEMNKDIDANRNDIYQYWYDKYMSRVKEYGQIEITEDRIIQEAAMYAERSDISEEVTRIYAHVEHLRQAMQQGGSCGKKLDFLCQEFNREFNTVGSKSSKISIINNVVKAKSELDKIREQVQNIV